MCAVGGSCCQAQGVTLPPPPPGVQTSTSFGIQFSTVQAAGNRAANPSELVFYPYGPHPESYGSVGYNFRLARTELTYAQLYPMVRAFVRVSPFGENFQFGTPAISFTGGNVTDPDRWMLDQSRANEPAIFYTVVAAMYCNWLQNNEATTLDAFFTGSYDLTGWASGQPLGRLVRSPDARYWIPTVDEWVKGMYYDVDRYGPAQDGYWWYPFRSNMTAQSGAPGSGAQSDYGQPFGVPPYPVGSYPNAASPWGLFGGSGGAPEFVLDEGVFYLHGSQTYFGNPYEDSIDYQRSAVMERGGVRIASVVPAPAIGSSLLLGLMSASVRLRSR
jgi:hypothetical protein